MSAEAVRSPHCATESLRILHVVPTYYPAVRYGGPIRSVHGLASSLAARGHDVHVYTTNVDGPGESDVPLDSPVTLNGVQIRYFRVPALRRLYWSPTLKSCLTKTIRDFDIVHLHSVYLWPTAVAARAARDANVPYLISPRGMLVGDLIRRKSRWVKTAWIKLVEQQSLAASAALHVTASLEAMEAGALGLRLPEIVCVPNGVDLPNDFAPLEEGPYADVPRPYVLFLSRINWKKGLDRLIRAWRLVHNAHLVIAGNDEENYLAKLQAMPEYAEIAERVRIIGPVSDTHKWALYKNARAFALPSYSENFGNVVAEAMSMACPVVVTSEVGLADFVRDTGAGIVCQGAPEELGNALRQLVQDEGAGKAMGAQGRRAVNDKLSWSAVGAEMETVYGRILQKKHSSPTVNL